jgi:hypothetical protein
MFGTNFPPYLFDFFGTNFSSSDKPIGASLLQQFLIGGWKEVRWAGGGWVGR